MRKRRRGRTKGPHCTKGKPCGNSCIAKDKVCHKSKKVGTGTASNPAPKVRLRFGWQMANSQANRLQYIRLFNSLTDS
jgi:hypothetical protein